MTTIHVSGALDTGPMFLRLLKTVERLRAARPDLDVVPVGYGRPDSWHRAVLPDLRVGPTAEGRLSGALDRAIRNGLVGDGLWLAGHAAEALSVVSTVRAHPGFLAPAPSVVGNHCVRVGALVDGGALRAWPGADRADGEVELHRFGRRWGWQVDIETPDGVAATASDRRSAAAALRTTASWPAVAVRIAPTWECFHEFAAGRATASDAEPTTWVTTRLSLTAHCGRLLSLTMLTDAGQVVAPDDVWRRRVTAAAQRLRWTGGAEIEVCGPPSGPTYVRRWSMGPPIWALLDANDPGIALLVEAALGTPLVTTRTSTPNGSLPQRRPDNQRPDLPELQTDALLTDLEGVDSHGQPTPFYCVLPGIMRGLWGRARNEVAASSDRPGPVAEICYSVKTNPAAPLLREALDHGFLAEAISQAEATWAADSGFADESTILNGPGKWWPASDTHGRRYRAILADSLPELIATAHGDRNDSAKFVGIRLRPSAFQSRFGEPIDVESTRVEIAAALRVLPPEVPPCVSFHLNSHWVGWHRWWRSLEEVLTAARDIERRSGRPIGMVDIGGGWHPDDWYAELLPELHTVESAIAEYLPSVRRLVLEPGKALCQPVCALVSRVLEIRPQRSEIVVDCSVAELQAALAYPRRRAWRPSIGGRWTGLSAGEGCIIGRLCMENDILATGVALPSGLAPGDLVAFGDAGAYDMSMSYGFARGGAHANSFSARQLRLARNGGEQR